MLRPLRACGLALVLAACCAAPPPVPPPEGVALTTECLPGSPLRGAVRPDLTGAPDASDPAAPPRLLVVHCVFAPGRPAESTTLAAHPRLILRQPTAVPIGAAPSALPGLRLVTGVGAQDWQRSLRAAPLLAQASAAVLPGTSTAVHLQIGAGRAMTWLVGSPTESLADSGAPCLVRGLRDDGVLEDVLIDCALRVGGAPLACHLPLAGGSGVALFLQLQASAPGADAVAQATTQLEAAGAGAIASTTAAPADARALAAALARLLDERSPAATRRGALLALAERCRAGACLELAWLADDALLAETMVLLPADLGARDAAATGLALELAAAHAIVPLRQTGRMPPALDAWCWRHFGVGSQWPVVLLRELDRCETLSAIEPMLIASNRDALQSGSAFTRVTACDWLRTRGIEIANYDPLGDAAARRAALAAATGAGR